jgi:hypothetical protein
MLLHLMFDFSKLISNRSILCLTLILSFIDCYSQEIDSSNRALEIYKIGKNKSYIIKIDQRVQIPCMFLKNGYRKIVTAELTAIDGDKLHFEPLNKNYHENVCTIKSIEKIGVRTTFRVVESTFWFVYKIIHFNWYNISDDRVRGTFRIINFKSKKWRARITELPTGSNNELKGK